MLSRIVLRQVRLQTELLRRTSSSNFSAVNHLCLDNCMNCHPHKNTFRSYSLEAKKSKKFTPNKELKNENNEADTGKIQAMPSNITKLITDTDLEEWPSFSNVSQVALRCHNVGVSIDQVEEFLIVQFRSQSEQQNTSKEKKKKKEDNFYSKHLCNKLIKSKEDESIRIENFLKYLEQNILSHADQVKIPLKRLEYTIAMWRLALVIQTCHINNKTQSCFNICGIKYFSLKVF